MDKKENLVFFQEDLMSASFSTFAKMREREELTDFKIAFGNRVLTGHRLILAAAIPFFGALFSRKDEEITLTGADPEALELLINFAYSGKIEITVQNVRSIFLTSEYLQVVQVRDACLEYLESNLQVGNVMEIHELATDHKCIRLKNASDSYVRENFETFYKDKSFVNVSFQYLKEIISGDHLKVNSEESVFEAAIQWVKFLPSERKSLLPELLNSVRMCHLTPEYLVKRVSKEELVRGSGPCRDLVEKAKDYHLLPGEQSKHCNFTTSPRTVFAFTEECENATNHGRVFALCLNKVELSLKMLDLKNAQWINLSTRETKDVQAAVALKGQIYIFRIKTHETFDLQTRNWNVQDDWPFSGVVLHDNMIYSFGGDKPFSRCVMCFDTRLNTWLKRGKTTRELVFHGVAAMKDCVYVTGGVSGHFKTDYCSTAETYNPKTTEWKTISPMLSARHGHGCASLNGKVYVCGGWKRRKRINTTEMYDPSTNEWNLVAPMNKIRTTISLIANDGKLFAHKILSDGETNKNFEIYDPELDKWKFGVPVPISTKCKVILLKVPN